MFMVVRYKGNILSIERKASRGRASFANVNLKTRICSELVYTVVIELSAILYYLTGLKSYLLVTQFPRI